MFGSFRELRHKMPLFVAGFGTARLRCLSLHQYRIESILVWHSLKAFTKFVMLFTNLLPPVDKNHTAKYFSSTRNLSYL